MANDSLDAVAPGRRKLLSRALAALTALGGAVVALPALGFIFGPLLKRTPQTWRAVGRVDRFRSGETVNVVFEDPSPLPWAGVTSRTAAWLRRTQDGEFVAFSVNCAHLGCPVRWLASAELFLCPCHGGVYNADGSVAAGPPPHGLVRYPVRVRDGQVEIQTRPIPIG